MREWVAMRCAGTLIAGGCFFLALTGSAQAVQFNVNSHADSPDKTDIDSKCKAKNGKCTLRAAVTEANVQPGLDVVKLGNGTYRLTIPGSGDNDEGDLDVFEQVELKGAGAGKTTIRQTAKDRILEVHSGATSVERMKLTGGRAKTSGGAILSHTALTVTKAVLSGNTVKSKDANGARGGAIEVEGTFTMTSSKVTGNKAIATEDTSDGGGVAVLAGSWIVDRSVISNNDLVMRKAASDAAGGGLEVGVGGHLLNSTISGNTANAGGGLFSNSGGSVLVEASTISNNTAKERGGGIQSGNGNMTIFNSTLSGNDVTHVGSGGALIRFSGGVSVQYTTLAGNSSVSDGGTINAGTTPGNVTFLASLIEGPGSDCTNGGHIASNGWNVLTDGTCPLTGTGDLATMQAPLGKLADNGGFTKTRALKAGNDAIDHVTSGCPPPTVDQRGEDRPSGAACDAGSFEK